MFCFHALLNSHLHPLSQLKSILTMLHWKLIGIPLVPQFRTLFFCTSSNKCIKYYTHHLCTYQCKSHPLPPPNFGRTLSKKAEHAKSHPRGRNFGTIYLQIPSLVQEGREGGICIEKCITYLFRKRNEHFSAYKCSYCLKSVFHNSSKNVV